MNIDEAKFWNERVLDWETKAGQLRRSLADEPDATRRAALQTESTAIRKHLVRLRRQRDRADKL